MNELDVFHFEKDRKSFEDYAQANGGLYWYARDLAEMLGYESFQSFKNAVNKATRTCLTIEISVAENFIQIDREIDGRSEADWKLSRFACYLVAMNGDIKKPGVAAAQAYFATVAAAFQKAIQTATNVERVLIRDEVSVREVSLNSLAKQSGVENYPFFQNAGYRGMYNMNLAALREYKGVDGSRPLLDFMGNEELAANLFRITQTEARIRNENVRGQRALEVTAHHVGRKVRETMRELSGTVPEALPIAQDIKQVRSSLKSTHKGFAKIDHQPKRSE
jgi:DNA-damage-inducible protein D